jgi:serpin B
MGYEGSRVSMVILLPDKKDGLGALEKALAAKPQTGSALDAYMKDMKSPKVHVVLPKFKFTCQFSLGDMLQKLGMKLAFDRDNADFSGMSEKEKLFISAVLHKAFVDVNEEGTEAAAATAVVMRMGAMPHAEEPKQFVADHPFLFIIRDSQTGSVLFMGRVCDPAK